MAANVTLEAARSAVPASHSRAGLYRLARRFVPTRAGRRAPSGADGPVGRSPVGRGGRVRRRGGLAATGGRRSPAAAARAAPPAGRRTPSGSRVAPRPAASNAASTWQAHSRSRGDGANTSCRIGICRGWIADFAPKPSDRTNSASARSPASSSISGYTLSTGGGSPAARDTTTVAADVEHRQAAVAGVEVAQQVQAADAHVRDAGDARDLLGGEHTAGRLDRGHQRQAARAARRTSSADSHFGIRIAAACGATASRSAAHAAVRGGFTRTSAARAP